MSKNLNNKGDNVPALQLKDIKKTYLAGENSVQALKGVSINFRKNEFVSILGPSGCGKTTMLNIIGGLDRYTEGDLVIEGKSTTSFNDRDWDTYRNHRIGFIFQSYNLIPHQTVLSNVELALTISGVGKEERIRLAKEALKKVGLEKEVYKRPNQLSGGQCQRVAIARALVNEPDILLADEPTGALDSKTSVQIMELIKEIAQDRLVIMVTHNGDLAEEYSSRIISLKDGEVVEDTNPFIPEESQEVALADKEESNQKQNYKPEKIKRKKRSKMSVWTSFKLSMRNLFTKKGRTALTSFAGSIGIIGISLILAVSQGATSYINHVQESTLSSYPITLEQEAVDLMELMDSFMNAGKEEPNHPLDAVYKDRIIDELVKSLSNAKKGENDLASFKVYLESELDKPDSELNKAVMGVKYAYDFELAVYTKNLDGKIVKSDTGELMENMLTRFMTGNSGSIQDQTGSQTSGSSSMFASFMMGSGMWEEILSAKDGGTINDIVKKQYDLIYGDWPTQANEVVLIVNEHNELDDLTLYALGLIGDEEIDAILDAAQNGTQLPNVEKKWSYKEICEREYKTIFPYSAYKLIDGVYVNSLENPNDLILESLYSEAYGLKVKGIIRPNPESENHMIQGSIGYTYKLTEHILNGAAESDVVKAQKETSNIDVLTGLPFKSNTLNLTDEEKANAFIDYVDHLDMAGKITTYVKIKTLMPKELIETQTNLALESFTTREQKIDAIAEGYAMLSGGTLTADAIKGYLEAMTDAQLDQNLRPIVEAQVQMEYAIVKQQEIATSFGKATMEEVLQDPMCLMQMAPALNSEISSLPEDTKQTTLADYYDRVTEFSPTTYEDNLKAFGCIDLGNPSAIHIYATSFESKDVIVQAIEDYNSRVEEAKQIKYTDYMGILMSSITTIIDAITYILIAFVAISLVVSSIMIAVITLISVQERTKEIGILRSIGASKRDVSSLFNAETIIIGLISGLLGVGVTYLLCIPINLVLQALTDIPTLRAILPIGAAAILVGISVTLNLISGIIPSRSAAKKDPVVALRTE